MTGLMDRIADRAARRVMRWIAARTERTHGEWVRAMRAEMAAMDGGVERLRWALGGVAMAWRAGAERPSSWRMRAAPSVAERTTRALVVFAALIAVIRALSHRFPPAADESALLIAIVLIALLFARRLAPPDVVAIVVGQAVFGLVIVGFRAVGHPAAITSGGSVYLGMMVAGTLGALRASRRQRELRWAGRSDPAAWLQDALAATFLGELVMFGAMWTGNDFRPLPLEYLPSLTSHLALTCCALVGRRAGFLVPRDAASASR